MAEVADVAKASALNAIDVKNDFIVEKVIRDEYLLINEDLLVNNLDNWPLNRCRLIICWMRFFGIRLFAVTNSHK